MKKIIFINIILFLIITLITTGCINKKENTLKHYFSVSKNNKVYIAGSNLQYNPAKNEWRFALNAYDIIGINNELIDESYNGYIDLFAWGATGLSGVEPYSTIIDNTLYGNGHNSIANTKWDFSVAINKQLGSEWRMFTNDEIHYLLMFRKNAEKLFGYGMIDNIRGLFILPDDWKQVDNITFTPSVDMGFINEYNWYYTIGDKENYTYNIFTKNEWKLLEEAGAVFLPAAGMRLENTTESINISGHYWTSSNYGKEFANCLCLFEQDLFLEGNFDRSYGLSVRLIKDAK